MLRNRNIAFFIDVDNVGLQNENYANLIEQLNAMGSIVSGKIYGAGERKHKEIYADADLHGYRTERPMRVKRRGRKEFDARIFVDVVEVVSTVPAVDTVCIVAQPTDLVYLYSYLHSHGKKIVALDNADDASNAFIDEVIDLGIVTEIKIPKKPASKKPATKPAPQAQEPVEEQAKPDQTEELLREIERLRELANAPLVEEEPVAVQEEPAPVEETPKEEPAAVKEPVETREDPKEPAQKQEEPEQKAAPRTAYAPTNDSDLIRRIEEIRRNNQGEDEDFVDEIRKLLDGLE